MINTYLFRSLQSLIDDHKATYKHKVSPDFIDALLKAKDDEKDMKLTGKHFFSYNVLQINVTYPTIFKLFCTIHRFYWSPIDWEYLICNIVWFVLKILSAMYGENRI